MITFAIAEKKIRFTLMIKEKYYFKNIIKSYHSKAFIIQQTNKSLLIQKYHTDAQTGKKVK